MSIINNMPSVGSTKIDIAISKDTSSSLYGISITKDMIIECSSYDASKTESSKLQSLGNNKYKALSDTIVYTKEDERNIYNNQ